MGEEEAYSTGVSGLNVKVVRNITVDGMLAGKSWRYWVEDDRNECSIMGLVSRWR